MVGGSRLAHLAGLQQATIRHWDFQQAAALLALITVQGQHTVEELQLGKMFCGTGSNNKSRGWGEKTWSGAGKGGGNDRRGEDQKHSQDGVALPLGPAFMGIDINVRHD